MSYELNVDILYNNDIGYVLIIPVVFVLCSKAVQPLAGNIFVHVCATI